MPDTAGAESWDDVPVRDCYTKVQGQPCGPEHGWASWLGTFYRCTGTRTPGAAVAALDGDGRGVAAPPSPPPTVATAPNRDQDRITTTAAGPSWWRRVFGRGYVQPAPDEGEGEFLDYRESYRPHDCKVPGPLDGREDYHGTLASGTRWRCRRCGCEWALSEYYFPYRKWFRRDDPGEDEFKRTHDEDGRPLGATTNA